MKLDHKKLLEQEPEFAEFIKELLFESIALDDQAHGMVSSMYAFYSMGMSKDQVLQWMKQMQIMGNDNTKG